MLQQYVDAVEALLLSGSEIDIANASGYTPLHVRKQLYIVSNILQ